MSHAVLWYIARDGQQHGPYSDEDFHRLISTSAFKPTDLIWQPNFQEWISYADLQAAKALQTGTNDVRPRMYVAAAAKSLLRAPLGLATTFYKILRGPSRFAIENIDSGPRSLRRAIYFYLNIFVILFLIADISSRINFYTGGTESRALVVLAVQIIAAIPMMYAFNLLSKPRPSLVGLTEAILYLDAVYLTFFTVVDIAAAIPHYLGSSPLGDVDIIGTELERCHSQESLAHWLLRGDLTFYLESYSSPTADFLKQASYYSQFVIILPFCVMLGLMMRARFGASATVNAIAGAVVFALVVTGADWGIEKVLEYAKTHTTCHQTWPSRIREKYSAELIAESVAAHLNATVSAELGAKDTWIKGKPGAQLLEVMIRPQQNAEEERAVAAKLTELYKQLYCGVGATFSLARNLDLALISIVRSPTSDVLASQTLTPKDCAQSR